MPYTARPLPSGERPVAAVTGASSGFGEAIARELAAAGFDVLIGARRMDRLDALAAEIGGRAQHLDVTDVASVEAFAATLPLVHVLVNNAGVRSAWSRSRNRSTNTGVRCGRRTCSRSWR